MTDRIAVVAEVGPAIYTVEDHASILLMLNQQPNAVYAVCQRIGFEGPPPGTIVPDDVVSLEEWLGNLIEQFRVASLPHTKRSGSRDAFIFIRHSFPMFKTLGELAQEFWAEAKEVS
jgi:hypothetical protein